MSDRFYVSADTGRAYGILLGPYNTKKEAEAKVQLGSRLARDKYAEAAFYGFGVTRVKDDDVQVNPAFKEDGTCIGPGRAFKKSVMPACITTD